MNEKLDVEDFRSEWVDIGDHVEIRFMIGDKVIYQYAPIQGKAV